MPKLTLQNLFNQVIFIPEGKKVIAAIQEAGIDWMHACGTKGRCTTCRLIVLEGMDNFSALTSAEEKYRKEGRLKENERLLCQCTLSGEATGKVPEQTKFPHMKYSF